MRLPLLTLSIIGAALLAVASVRAADMVEPEPPAAYSPPPAVAVPPPAVAVPPPVVAVAPPVVVVRPPPANCWRYGAVGWAWYPCVAGPPVVYRHDYRYGYGYRLPPYWAHSQRWHRSYW